MDSRTAAHVLSEIASLLELHGENRFKARAYRMAARAVLALDTDDLAPLFRSGELAAVPGVGPATLSVLVELIETGESSYFERLRGNAPAGLLEMMAVPGLGTAKIQQIHDGLAIETLEELEEAARDGRLATLPGFGPKTAEKILKGIAFMRQAEARVLYHRALAEGHRLLGAVERHHDVVRAGIAGSLRRHGETIRDIDIVAACRTEPERVAASFGRIPGVREASNGAGGSVTIRFVDGTVLDLYCVTEPEFPVALWRATGSAAHLEEVERAAAARGLSFVGDRLRDKSGHHVPLAEERDLYRAIGLAFVPPELREGRGEVDAAKRRVLPHLVEYEDIRGVLHAHSRYSDGTATIAEMASAAQERGWSYLGISDHSQSAFYAGGLSRDAVLRQHDEIDEVNASLDGITVLKGIEADILPDGRIDYDAELLERFDYVIGSIHSRFKMGEAEMTERVLTALDDPHLTILAHPTGRLLLSREAYAIDLEAVIDKAGDVGVSIEINADPHRLDLDWRLCRRAKERGVVLEIGPDAHSTHGLDNVEFGVGIARKGWLERDDVLNAREVDEVVAFARKRRALKTGVSAER